MEPITYDPVTIRLLEPPAKTLGSIFIFKRVLLTNPHRCGHHNVTLPFAVSLWSQEYLRSVLGKSDFDQISITNAVVEI